jgi:hypothetical protein
MTVRKRLTVADVERTEAEFWIRELNQMFKNDEIFVRSVRKKDPRVIDVEFTAYDTPKGLLPE